MVLKPDSIQLKRIVNFMKDVWYECGQYDCCSGLWNITFEKNDFDDQVTKNSVDDIVKYYFLTIIKGIEAHTQEYYNAFESINEDKDFNDVKIEEIKNMFTIIPDENIDTSWNWRCGDLNN